MLLTGDANRSAGVHLWDLQSGREIPRFEKTDLPGPAVVLLTPDGKRVVAGCADGSIHLLDVANGTDVVPPRAAHAGSLTAICISADGKTVASAGADKRVRQWRLTEPATTRPTTQPASASPGIGASD
jgi:WD40 repeat protein